MPKSTPSGVLVHCLSADQDIANEFELAETRVAGLRAVSVYERPQIQPNFNRQLPPKLELDLEGCQLSQHTVSVWGKQYSNAS
jgi:hypothetical protein